ncbi:MAG: hypothetical protein JSS49_02795 [Planctomycetes bacterium]|nr:hypothetical protein [Planctomycetota bacterium]
MSASKDESNSEVATELPNESGMTLLHAKRDLNRLLLLLSGLVVLNGILLCGFVYATTPSVFVPRLAKEAEKKVDLREVLVTQGSDLIRNTVQQEVNRAIEQLPETRQKMQTELVARSREIVEKEKRRLIAEPYYVQTLAQRCASLVDQGYTPAVAADAIDQDRGEFEYPARVLVYSLSGVIYRVDRQLEIMDRNDQLNRRQASFRKTLQAVQTMRRAALDSAKESAVKDAPAQ